MIAAAVSPSAMSKEYSTSLPFAGSEAHAQGSVGQPRDDCPRACYTIYDSERRVVWFRRVAHDIPKAQERFLNAGLVSRSASRLAAGE
jgi:hypothetical protein